MPLSGYLSTTPSDILLSPAIIRVGATNLGVTKGPPKVDPMWEIVAMDFDGRHAPIKGLDRKFYGPASMSFTLLDIGPAATGNQIAKLEAGSSAATAGGAGVSVTTITPKAGGGLYASGDYLSNVRCIWERGVGSGTTLYYAMHFAVGLVTKWTVTDQSRDWATVEITIEARKDMASGTVQDAPYVVEYREALP